LKFALQAGFYFVKKTFTFLIILDFFEKSIALTPLQRFFIAQYIALGAI
jgi:hypothetical protein